MKNFTLLSLLLISFLSIQSAQKSGAGKSSSQAQQMPEENEYCWVCVLEKGPFFDLSGKQVKNNAIAVVPRFPKSKAKEHAFSADHMVNASIANTTLDFQTQAAGRVCLEKACRAGSPCDLHCLRFWKV